MDERVKFCAKCGGRMSLDDRFCGNCGFDTQAERNSEPVPSFTLQQQMQPMVGDAGTAANGRAKHKAVVLAACCLMGALLLGGGVYWWISQKKSPPAEAAEVAGSSAAQGTDVTRQTDALNPSTGQDTEGTALDLTKAATYLSESGLVCTFNVHYPDGTAGIVTRTSGQVAPGKTIRVSEVETGTEQGEEFGFGVHYAERADGIYGIYDDLPYESTPLLKNELTTGQTWKYQTEYGDIVWTVLDMGVELDLGFRVFKDCLVVQENNQAVEFQSITYYSPGVGSIYVIDPSGSTEFYRMTALEKTDAAQAAAVIQKWCPNYSVIEDDRSQAG